MKIILNRVLIAASCLLTSTQVLAAKKANDRGNGGKLMVCDEQSGHPRYQILDLFEGSDSQTGWGLTPDLGAADLTADEKVMLVLNRLSRVDPDKSILMKSRFADFYKNTVFVSDRVLVDIPDVGPATMPYGCKLAQIAVQKKPELPNQFLYTIANDYWKEIGANNQAALILHELVYGLTNGKHPDSTKVRYFTAHLASTRLETMSVSEFDELAKISKLPRPVKSFGQYPLLFSTLTKIDEDSWQGDLANEVIETIQAGKTKRKTMASKGDTVVVSSLGELKAGRFQLIYLVERCDDQDSERNEAPLFSVGDDTKKRVDFWIEFYQNRFVKKITADVAPGKQFAVGKYGEVSTGRCSTPTFVSATVGTMHRDENIHLELIFDENGNPKTIHFPFNLYDGTAMPDGIWPTNLSASVNRPSTQCRSGLCSSIAFSGLMNFYENGFIKSGQLRSQQTFLDRVGQERFCPQAEFVEFDKEGYLLSPCFMR